MRGFRILVVEDQPETLEQTMSLLTEAIPGSKIDKAQSVQEAIRMINEALECGESYDLVILDFKLPAEPGGHDSIDESVCKYVGEIMPSTVIGHMSSWLEDPKIVLHLSRDHEGRPLGFILNKRESSWGIQLIAKSKQALHGARIERRIAELFSSQSTPQPDGPSARLAAPRRSGSATNRLMELTLDIAEAWKELSPHTRKTVRKYFVVEDANGAISVVKR